MRWILPVLAALAVATSARAAEVVDVGEGEAALNAVLFRPQGPGPFPVVVGLHGCAGMLTPSGQIVRRFADWGERLSKAGVAVLFVDSYLPRGLGPQCAQPRAPGAQLPRARQPMPTRRGAGCRASPG